MAIIVKRQRHRERFDERKVYASVYAACVSADYAERRAERMAKAVAATVERFIEGKRVVPSTALRQKITALLRKKDRELAFYYEVHLPDLKRL